MARPSSTTLLERLDYLTRTGRHEEVKELSQSAHGGEQDVAHALIEAGTLSEMGVPSEDAEPVTRAAFAAADSWWAAGEGENATYALSAGLRVLFHRERHADVERSPLASMPERFLAPLADSKMFTDIISARSVTGRETEDPSDGEEIVVLKGTYPAFADPLIAALDAQPNVAVRPVEITSADKRMKWLGINTAALAWRIAAHPNGPKVSPPRVSPSVLDGAGVVVADWGDRGAVWASLNAPANARVVVRLHGNDVFAPWIHFIDWTRVSDLIVVSAPLGGLVKGILGTRLAHVRVHVIPHAPDPERFRPSPEEAEERTIGMIGWGKLVKDPAWALDVLAELLSEGEEWRLLLLGDPLEISGSTRTKEYASRVWERIRGEHSGRVERVPFTKNVPAVARRMGFILSASRRESFHLGLAEGALAGAVPVVRSWPVYGRNGAECVYPGEWVVGTPAEAAERIREHVDRREESGIEARAEIQRRFSKNAFIRNISRAVLTTPDSPVGAITFAKRVVSDLNLIGATSKGIVPAARGALVEADECLAIGDVDGAAERASLALEVLFHRELHSDGLTSVLVENPDACLAPLRESEVGRLLTGSTTPLSARQRPAATPTSCKVLVTPGPFNAFHEWVVQALREQPGANVTVASRDRGAGFNSMRIDPKIVRARLAHALGEEPTGYAKFAKSLEGQNVVLLDWADKMAVIAAMLAPPDARLIVRLHSVDFLRPWLHLIDWSRIESIICLSNGMARLTRDLLRKPFEEVGNVPIHVVRNEAPVTHLEKRKSPRSLRTIGMIGWAKRVKDPIWAIDVLARLVKEDPEWRLVLIGPDFSDRPTASGAAYERAFRERARRSDVRNNVIYVGFTEDVSSYLQEVGFLLSSSRRESFHRAVLEGALSGAVPIVRDWPVFAKHHAAESVYPAEWVVNDVDGAVKRIKEYSTRTAWAEESRKARIAMLAQTGLPSLSEAYRAIVFNDRY